MARRNGVEHLLAKPTVGEVWNPQVLHETKRQITEQAMVSSEVQVPLNAVHLNFSFTPTQTPLRYHYDSEQIAQWAEADIKVNGILSPLWVRPLPGSEDTGEPAYELIAGMRRYLAAKHLKLATVPVKVFNWNDAQAYQAGASENLNSRGFTPIEELDHMLHFLSQSLKLAIDEVPPLLYRMANASKGNTDPAFLESDDAQSVQQVFSALGQMTWQSFVQNRLRLRSWPADVINAMRQGKLSFKKASELTKLKSQDAARANLLRQVISESSLTLEEIKAEVAQIKRDVAADAAIQTDPNLPIFSTESTESESEPEPHRTAKQLFKQLGNKRNPVWQNPSRAKKIRQYLEKIRLLMEEAAAEQFTDSDL